MTMHNVHYCGLFNKYGSFSGYMVLKGGMIDELEEMWKEVVVV